MKNLLLLVLISLGSLPIFSQSIPLPEHPNPITMRSQWLNLNGQWAFEFDSLDIGVEEQWFLGNQDFSKTITVPFPWGSELSGVDDEADIAWYNRSIQIPDSWNGKRTFIIIGASDWETHVWIDGQIIGSHQGGYIPFEFDLTEYVKSGSSHNLVIRVDDAKRAHTLYGKQGYGNARGMWQTPYLEARGKQYIETLHIEPNIDKEHVVVKVYLPEPVKEETKMDISIDGNDFTKKSTLTFYKDQRQTRDTISIPNPKLWTLEDPFLYQVKATIANDELHSYFGMRKISVMNLPGTTHPYVALNNKPIYLQLALDQSYHPEGYYTFPSDQFMIEEILRSKSIGLNGIRTHIKVEVPRKLYWADKLGLLVMEDLPNSWGEPEEMMRRESTYTLEEMIKRDYNHPSIFSWVIMNETWGLFTKTGGKNQYLPETQKWVASLYHLAKSLDNSRIIEDNSICCGRGHTVTDLNSWHVYLPGYAWDSYLSNLSNKTFIGSTHNYEEGYQQGPEPNINSECGNVWGYSGSTGDVDWSWDYHRMMNAFRKYPKIGGWLYTEHHDVINEWNGYWRFDRTEKFTGLPDLVQDMSLNDFHAPIYLSTGQDIAYTAAANTELNIPLFLSIMTDKLHGEALEISYQMDLLDRTAKTHKNIFSGKRTVPCNPWDQLVLDSLTIQTPKQGGLAQLTFIVQNAKGDIVHRNFIHIIINESSKNLDQQIIVSIEPKAFEKAQWTDKTWDVLDGKKINGAGNGFFSYTFSIAKNELPSNINSATILLEASAKELFVKDKESYNKNQDFMKGSRVFPSSNPNSYPMTDETYYPSEVDIYINDQKVKHIRLEDDPADHRGVLSWHAQPQDRKLREAGSYGYLINYELDKNQIQALRKDGSLTLKLQSTNGGGLAIYGKNFGRYPLDPSLIIN